MLTSAGYVKHQPTFVVALAAHVKCWHHHKNSQYFVREGLCSFMHTYPFFFLLFVPAVIECSASDRRLQKWPRCKCRRCGSPLLTTTSSLMMMMMRRRSCLGSTFRHTHSHIAHSNNRQQQIRNDKQRQISRSSGNNRRYLPYLGFHIITQAYHASCWL
jgi:hypothetical protein